LLTCYTYIFSHKNINSVIECYVEMSKSSIFYLIHIIAEDFDSFMVMRLSGVETNFGGKEIRRPVVLEIIDSHY
jgi:hypothetical protein